MISVNQRAATIVRQMVDEEEALGIRVRPLDNGAAVVDCGVEAPGSLEAGRLFACACLGGLGGVGFAQQVFGGRDAADPGFWLPSVITNIGHPHIACMASQYAGWAIRLDGYSAIGSGPARALYAGEGIYRKLGYRDHSDTAVLMLEARDLPGAAVASFVAERCRVRPEQLTILIAPTASLTGSVQIAARAAETGLHKLMALGFDIRNVKSALGQCPLAPVAGDDLRAIGRTNDAVLYGSRVFYSVEAEDDEIAALIDKIPSTSSRDYGVPFYDLFMKFDRDFYKIDPLLFSPAEVEINNLKSGRTFQAGCLNPSVIRASLLDHQP